MKKLLPLCGCLIIAAACHDEATPLPCPTPQFAYTVNITASDSCEANGTFGLTGAGSNDYQYRINEGPFQNTPLFVGLFPGKYQLSIKNSNCIYTDSINIPGLQPGPLFTQVKNLVAQHCVSCHGPTGPQAAPDFTQNCTIVRQAQRIFARAFFGNPGPMPVSGLLPLGERNKLSVWIAAGAKFTD